MRRKLFYLLSTIPLALFTLALVSAGDPPPPPAPAPPNPAAAALKVILVTPEGNAWRIADVSSHLDVILVNAGDKPISVYDMENSWGWYNIKLEWTIGDKKGTVVHVVRGWDSNAPSTTQIAPGGAVVQRVGLGADWRGWPTDFNGKEMTVRVVYESKEAYPVGLPGPAGWHGAAKSDPVTFRISDDRTQTQ